MRTLGVDLASQPKSTGLAVLTWAEGRARVDRLELQGTDERVVELASEVDATGIDAPFGWPLEHVELVSGEREPEEWSNDYRDRLRFRATDREVRSLLGRWPLSVSSDLIAIPAMRCQGLLARLSVRDRSGDGRVFEVYPALALHRWGLPSRGYKKAGGAETRATLWRELCARAPWLEIDERHTDVVAGSCDALDAIVAAMVARAAALGASEPVPPADAERARTEGWIVVPALGSLRDLGAQSQSPASV